MRCNHGTAPATVPALTPAALRLPDNRQQLARLIEPAL